MKAFKIAALASALSLGLMLTSNGANAPCDKMEKVTAVWLPIMQTTAYYVALEEKLFEKACIEIVSQKLEAPNQIIDALVAERAPISGRPARRPASRCSRNRSFRARFKVFGLQGGGIKVNLINDGLIVKKGSTIKTFADLKGKKLGHIPGIQWRTISRHMVRSAGLDPTTDVTLLDLAVGMQMPAVVGGSVDATLSLEPVGSIAVASGQAMRAMTNPVVDGDRRSVLFRRVAHDRQSSCRNGRRSRARSSRRSTRRRAWPTPISTSTRPSSRNTRRSGEQQLELLAKPYLRGVQRAQRRRPQFLSGAGRRVPEGRIVLAQRMDVRGHILRQVRFASSNAGRCPELPGGRRWQHPN